MSVYLVSYDLNGKTPSHKQMDEHMASLGWRAGRALETVWIVATPDSLETVYDKVTSILSGNDTVFVGHLQSAKFDNLLISESGLRKALSQDGVITG